MLLVPYLMVKNFQRNILSLDFGYNQFYPGPSMWFSKQINWIISEAQRKNFFEIFFTSFFFTIGQAALGSEIETYFFFH